MIRDIVGGKDAFITCLSDSREIVVDELVLTSPV